MNLLTDFLRLGVIIGAFPNTIVNGQLIDATPVMADFNWILSQVNANAAAASDLATTNANVASILSQIGTVNSYTPVVSFAAGTGSVTYNSRAGFYVQVGKFIIVSAQASISGIGTGGGIAQFSIPVAATATKMPYNGGYGANSFGMSSTLFTFPAGTTGLFGFAQAGQTYIECGLQQSSGSAVDLAWVNLTAPVAFGWSGFYFTD